MDNETTRMMQDVAAAVNNFLNGNGPKNTGFVLLVFPMAEEPTENTVNYVSNYGKGQRAEIVKALRSVANRLDPEVH